MMVQPPPLTCKVSSYYKTRYVEKKKAIMSESPLDWGPDLLLLGSHHTDKLRSFPIYSKKSIFRKSLCIFL